MKPLKIILTGASGTLGRNILEVIGRDQNYEILALLRPESRACTHFKSVHELRFDLNDRELVRAAFSDFRPSVVIHSAAAGMELVRPPWNELVNFNINVSANLCEQSAAFGVKHFIFIGTGLAYRSLSRPLHESDPLDTPHPYGATKAASDLLVRSISAELALPLTVLRPFSYTGVGDDRTRLFPSLLRSAEAGRDMELTSGSQIRDHLSARDVAAGVLAALGGDPDPKSPRIYNLGCGSMDTVKQMVSEVVSELGIPVNLRFGARPDRPFDPAVLAASNKKAQRELLWRPRHRLAHAVWELACESFPSLSLKEPRKYF